MQTSRLRDRELQVSHSGKVLVGGWRGTTEGGSCFSSASFLSCLAEDPLPHCTSGSSVHWVPDLTHVIRSTISRQTNRRQASHGAFLWWGSMERPVGRWLLPSDPNSSEPVFYTHGTGHSLPPCSSQALERGSLANWYELWPRVIIFLRISEVAKQLKGLS